MPPSVPVPPASTSRPLVLVCAASDPTGGAGIQADLLAIAAQGCHALTAVTGLTAQDTVGIAALYPVPAAQFLAQARAVVDDMAVAALKVGLVGSIANVEAIAGLIDELNARRPGLPVVVDPVLASGRGDPLADAALIDALRRHLLPRTTVLTPNSLEARRLVGAAADRPLAGCAADLLAAGCAQVLITGTHEASAAVVNTLYSPGIAPTANEWPRLPGSFHGSGCTLASALAAQLARGLSVPAAAAAAEHFTWHALAAGFAPGRGQFIPDRLYRLSDACDSGERHEQ